MKRRVPAERLLVYEVKDGWEPLCDFPGVTVPEGKPFPHLNDAEAFRRMLRRRSALASAALVGGASLIGLALLYLLSGPHPGELEARPPVGDLYCAHEAHLLHI